MKIIDGIMSKEKKTDAILQVSLSLLSKSMIRCVPDSIVEGVSFYAPHDLIITCICQ